MVRRRRAYCVYSLHRRILMHPLASDFENLKDSELESKIAELTRKYFMTSNMGLREQIAALLNSYQEELGNRRRAEWNRMMENRDKGLDKLINID